MPISAVIFDLDGVVTDTVHAHSFAWKELFDEYLQEHSLRNQEDFVPFEIETDYTNYVDGKPRYKGVASFLASRNISLPFGNPSDDPSAETVCGLGNKKNIKYQEIVQRDGVEVYDSTITWIKKLQKNRIRLGMATSSKNGPLILKITNLTDLFEASIDGNDLEKMGLHGKPEPDMFLECAKLLKVDPKNCAVVEDAISGVQAGRKGSFALVIGMIRNNSKESLEENGADIAVEDLTQIELSRFDISNPNQKGKE